MNHPTQRSLEQARRIYLFGECKCDHNGVCDLHTDIARELDAAREGGQRAGKAETATYIEGCERRALLRHFARELASGARDLNGAAVTPEDAVRGYGVEVDDG